MSFIGFQMYLQMSVLGSDVQQKSPTVGSCGAVRPGQTYTYSTWTPSWCLNTSPTAVLPFGALIWVFYGQAHCGPGASMKCGATPHHISEQYWGLSTVAPCGVCLLGACLLIYF